MIWTLFLDCLISGLLVVTIVLAMILNRRFSGLRRDRAEFSTVAAEFHRTVARAEDSVARLKTTTAELDSKNNRAAQHEDDLRLLIERADAAADRLEEAVRAGRPAMGGQVAKHAGANEGAKQGKLARLAADGTATAGTATAGGGPRSEAERDLLHALRFQR